MVNLEELPAEVLHLIVNHLSTVQAITSLSQTSKKLHAIVCGDESVTYKPFVERSFPSIPTPSTWREVAKFLTSRSRAWDRRALLVRECCPPENLQLQWRPNNGRRPQMGYVPALDSYDDLTGNSIANRRETVAWGAAGKIFVRTTDRESRRWRSLNFEDDDVATNDILQLRLLRPHQKATDAETIVFRRAFGEVATLETADNEAGFHQHARFTGTHAAQLIAVNDEISPVLAISSAVRLQLYKVQTPEADIAPLETIELDTTRPLSDRRARSLQFLNSGTVALSTTSHDRDLSLEDHHIPIKVYDINGTRLSDVATPLWSSAPCGWKSLGSRQYVHILLPLDHGHRNSNGNLFLSGWNTGLARLHDTRAPESCVAQWEDTVDTGQIISLAAIGHERFLAGSDQNACLKTFDLRKPGDHRYSYLDARRPIVPHPTSPAREKQQQRLALTPPQSLDSHQRRYSHLPRDVNYFISVRTWRFQSLRTSLPPATTHNNTVPYSGSIYSLSIPSPTSPTIYAGIENHVLQLDFTSTDDIKRGRSGVDHVSIGSQATHEAKHGGGWGNGVESFHNTVFDVASYERPRPGYEATDAVLLNKQVVWHELDAQPQQNREAEDAGWDRRWRLGKSVRKDGERKQNDMGPTWGRGGGHRRGNSRAAGGGAAGRRGSASASGGGTPALAVRTHQQQ
ncbi:uncharacterized protein AB675_10861 [Cyphellophora attinorum]|uniref:F-box domain-containing protein n=1 Tax=Cyphellophora attinorum TaxID=1664694 RepID=A0A0N1NZ34_9EURO|nr:uncharacterized protein AB675_10861 [Phialophora attinorum]KPI40896.1 hypothetical protein AB675_10861 [Phialophora attinorum]